MALAKNSMEGKAQKYLARIETLHGDLDSEKGAYMARCKVIREDVREIYIEAKNQGILVKSLKALVKDRQLECKQQELKAGLDIDEAAAFDQLKEALGELGMAAAKRAGHAPEHPRAAEYLDSVEADDKRDFRPSNLRNTNPEDVEKLGRGPVEAA